MPVCRLTILAIWLKRICRSDKNAGPRQKALDSLDKSLYRVASLYCRTKTTVLHKTWILAHISVPHLKKHPWLLRSDRKSDGDNYVAYTNGTLITDGLLDMKYLIQPKDSTEIEQPKTNLNVVSERPDAAEYNLVKETESTRIYRNPYSANIIYASNRALLNQKFFTTIR